jgi:hypothetical protein
MLQSKLRRARIAAMPGSDNYADAVATFVNLVPLAVEPSWGLKYHERDLLTSDAERFQSVPGEREAGLKLSLEGKGTGTPAGAAVVATDGESGLLLKSCFGNQTKDTGAAASAASTASLIKTTGALLSLGGFVGSVDPATGLYHARQIRTKTGVGPYDLTLCRALPHVPAAAAVVYAASWFSRAVDGHQHLWADVEEYDAVAANNWRVYLRGLLGSFALKGTGAKGKVSFDFDFKAVDWSDTAKGTTMGALAPIAGLPTTGMFARVARVWVDAVEQKVLSFDFDLGNEIGVLEGTAAANGVRGFYVKGAKQTFKFTSYWSDGCDALLTKWKAGTTFDLLVELCQGGPGKSLALAAPVVEIIDVKDGDADGLRTREFTCNVLRNDATTVPPLALGLL